MYDPRDIEAWLIEQKEERTAGAALSQSQHSQKSAPGRLTPRADKSDGRGSGQLDEPPTLRR